jgi:G3E family GTPase
MIPVSMVTGFLGSGKTTLLNRLLREPGLHGTLVLVNEFGDIGIDHLLYDVVDRDIILLESGCVCCSIRDDFADTLLRFLEHHDSGLIPELRRAVVETTGVADPTQILQILLTRRELQTKFRPGSILTLVDGQYGDRTLDQYLEAVQQAAFADYLVISKADVVQAPVIEALRNRLAAINPRASIFASAPQNPPDISLDALDRPGFGLSPDPDSGPAETSFIVSRMCRDRHPVPRHDSRFSTFTLTWQGPVDWNDVLAWLEGLLGARGEDVFRIKGLLHVKSAERPILLQTVQHSVYPPAELRSWPRGTPQTELVFITRDFSRTAAINSLKYFVSAVIQ